MTVCYAQLRLKGLSDYTNFSFTAQFISQDTGRKFETSKLKIHATGISVEASFQLQKNENAKNCSVRFNVFLPTGRLLEPRPFMGVTYTKESDRVTPPFLIELMGRKSKALLLFKNRWTTIY